MSAVGAVGPDPLDLRPLAPADLPAVHRLERELFGAGAWSPAMLAEELHGPDRWYVAAVERHPTGTATVRGYAGLWFDGQDAQVMTIGVAAARQGTGVGRRLLSALVDRARALGADSVLLEVRVDNEPALTLYRRFGFTTLARRRGYYQPENADAWTMRLDLGTARHVPAPAARETVLIDAAALRDLLQAGRPIVVLDVRWALGRTDGREQHAAGHVPGAVYVDLDTELAGPPSAGAGRHPLPDPADLEAAARRWGVRAGVPVVAYDAVGGTSAARAWWLLRWAGVHDVRLLDGGLGAWTESGGAVDTGDVTPRPGDVVVRPGAMPTLDADAVALLARGDGHGDGDGHRDGDGHGHGAAGVVLDARAPERYRGEVEPVDPRAGHVPGAVSAPTAGNLDAHGRFLPTDALRERFAALGVTTAGTTAVYCGSGVTAAHDIAALAAVGVTAALYPGSWSQWSADPSRPAAVGAHPG